MRNRTHKRVADKKVSNISGTKKPTNHKRNVIHRKSTEPKIKIYNKITLNKKEIDLMFAAQNQEAEFFGAMDYDPLSKHPSVIRLERGEESKVTRFVKRIDADYEIVFHTHPIQPLPTAHLGPSPADLSNMAFRSDATKMKRNKEFLVENDGFLYSYSIPDKASMKTFNDSLKNLEYFLVKEDKTLFKDIQDSELVDIIYFEIWEEALTNNKSGVGELKEYFNVYQKYQNTNIDTFKLSKLSRKDRMTVTSYQKKFPKIQKELFAKLEQELGIVIKKHPRDKNIKTYLEVQHNPMRKGRSNPQKRAKRIAQAIVSNPSYFEKKMQRDAKRILKNHK
ncbi:hypothetical protein LCGC14_1287140 [marine sediment metagenome]|uniref:Uncharacterized protein n=1 Tax=marine sediment metagenome TaxID=412755 RepID=A0A0F9KVA4_9ZZZZ